MLSPPIILLSTQKQFCERDFEMFLRPFLYATVTCWSMYSSWNSLYTTLAYNFLLRTGCHLLANVFHPFCFHGADDKL